MVGAILCYMQVSIKKTGEKIGIFTSLDNSNSEWNLELKNVTFLS